MENRQQKTVAVPERSEERGTLHQAAKAWNIDCYQYEIREIIFHALSKQAREMQEVGCCKREDILQK